MTEFETRHRPIRSYVRREGRLTKGQQRALNDLLPRFGVTPGEGLFDFRAIFGREAPVILDIGFGDGEALAQMAAAHPQWDFLGIEVHRPGAGHLLLDLEKRGLTNVRAAIADANEVLRRNVPDGGLAGIDLFFPDPWPKKRHHKRRLVQPQWLELAVRKLQPGGFLHLATDWADYAEHMLAVVTDNPDLENPAGPDGFAPDRGDRPETKFERRGMRKGHRVYDLIVYRKR